MAKHDSHGIEHIVEMHNSLIQENPASERSPSARRDYVGTTKYTVCPP